MKSFHPFSFTLGTASGLLVLALYLGIASIADDEPPRVRPSGDGAFQEQNRGFVRDPAAMAERLGMTEKEIQDALAAGKTMQELLQEHNVELPVPLRGTGSRMQRGIPGDAPAAQSGATASGVSIPLDSI
jgi:hypothetical protein